MASKSGAGRAAGKEATEKKAEESVASGKGTASVQGTKTETVSGSFEKAGKALAGFRIVEVDEEDRKLRRRANRIRKAMLQDLWARGLTAAPATGRKNGEIAVAAAWAGAGSSAGGDKDRGAIYADMVEDYVALWITRERLEADIAERGVTVFDEKRGLPVENCSVSARVRVSKQMTTIMQTLGYKDQAIKARRPEGDADDEL